MITIKDLINTSANAIKIDWVKVEETIGFPLHYDLKNFYSRILCEEQKSISDNFNLVEDKFIQKTGNERFDTWFSFNECEGESAYELFLIKVPENASKEIEAAFTNWTGGNDFGHRVSDGTLWEVQNAF